MFLCLSIKRPVALRLVPIQTYTRCALDAGAIGEPRARTCRLARSTPLIGAVVDFHLHLGREEHTQGRCGLGEARGGVHPGLATLR